MPDSFLLDGLELNDAVTYGVEDNGFDLAPAKQRQEWIGAADSEDQRLARTPRNDNRVVPLRIAVVGQASADGLFDAIGAIVDKLQAASRFRDGISLAWTPNGSNRTITYTVYAGEIPELPADWESGFLALSPTLTLNLTCSPYAKLPAVGNITDDFSVDTIADYTFVAGAAGNVNVTGGVLDASANLTTENAAYYNAAPYDFGDVQVTVRTQPGSTLTGWKGGVIVKRVATNTRLEVYVDDDGANSRLRIDTLVSSTRTNRASVNLGARVIASTPLWVRGRIEGNVITAEHFTSAPTVSSTPTTTTSYTLTAGSQADTFGAGVAGKVGWVLLPQQTSAFIDDFTVQPNLYRSAAPALIAAVYGVPGDVPAEAILEVDDTASQSRRHVEWGREGPLTFDASTSLLIDSDSLVTSGFAGTQTTSTGAYDPNASGNSVITASVTTAPTAICSTGNQSHVGVFKAKVRAKAGTSTQLRISYQIAGGQWISRPWVTSHRASGWLEMDLGTVTIPRVKAGTQAWIGRIDGRVTQGSPGTPVIDYLLLEPVAAGHGKARASYSYQPGVVTGYDDFTSTTAGANLSGTTADDTVNAWTTTGSPDFQFSDALAGEQGTRIDATGTAAYARLGSTNYTDTEVSVTVYRTANGASSDEVRQGAMARYVDTSNHLRGVIITGGTSTLSIIQVVAGVTTTIASAPLNVTAALANTSQTLRLIAFASGRSILQVLVSGQVIQEVEGTSSDLAAGGALDDGKPGMYDYSALASTRYYEEFRIGTPAPEPIALYSGRSIQFRHDDTIRQDSTGVYYGRPPLYQPAGRFLLDPGDNRVFIKGRRTDVDTDADENISDALQAQITLTPRVLAVPRG